jgi:hypothetical protein
MARRKRGDWKPPRRRRKCLEALEGPDSAEKHLPLPRAVRIHFRVIGVHFPVNRRFARPLPMAILLSTLLAGLAPLLQASIPDYKLGDVATDDVITPVSLSVPRPDATDALKQNLAQQAPSIVRFLPSAAAESEADLRARIAEARKRFSTALRAALQDREPIASDLSSPAYNAAVAFAARDATKNLPLETLAPLWLRQQDDQPFVDSLVKPLRLAMAETILVPAEADASLPENLPVRLVAVKGFSQPVSIDGFDTSGPFIAAQKLISLRQAQRLAESQFPAGQERVADFVSGFVRANAKYDHALTEIVRAKRSSGFAITDTFEAAQVIVHKGQTIDRKTLSALAVLREKTLIGALQSKLDQEQTIAGQIHSQTTWITATLALITIALLLILWRLRTRPAAPTSTAMVVRSDSADGAPEGEWQNRALIAEGKVERAHQAIRSGVMGWMREKVFHTLFRHRSELLASQQRAESEIQELEQRLQQLHAPLQDRLTSYQKRIQELEEELNRRRLAQDVARQKVDASKHTDHHDRRLETDLAEREKSVAEIERRLAERTRDLDELDALLRARERLISANQNKSSSRILLDARRRTEIFKN